MKSLAPPVVQAGLYNSYIIDPITERLLYGFTRPSQSTTHRSINHCPRSLLQLFSLIRSLFPLLPSSTTVATRPRLQNHFAISNLTVADQSKGMTLTDYAPLIPATAEGLFQWKLEGEPAEGGLWKTWYRITGDLSQSKGFPIILAHGGPGCTSDYLFSMADLSKTGRAIIHYDQIGNGRSTHLPEKAGDGKFWDVPLFVQEVYELVKHLKLETYYFLGQSWGGFLAQEFAYTKPKGLRAVVLANTSSSFPEFSVACDQWRAELPPEVEATLKKHEAAGTFDDPEYAEACTVFYNRHVCRMVPNPTEVQKSFQELEDDKTVYGTMNGPTEFHVIGSLKDWTFTDRLPKLTYPILIVSGKYDEAAPFIQETLKKGLPHAESHLFQHSSHLPHVEERDLYMQIVGDWLKKQD